MKEQARDKMIRDRFIAGQEQRALRRQLDGFAQDTPIGEMADSCRVWESHSDSNWIPREHYESEVESRSSDSQAWERREAEVFIGRRELEAEREKSVYIEEIVNAVRSCVEETRARERNGATTGEPACGLGGSDGHEANRHSGVGAVQLQQIKTGWPHGPNRLNQMNNKGRKLRKSPGNERRSGRGGGGGGGSASRTSEDQSSIDPGGGPSRNTQGGPPWQIQGDHNRPGQWSANSREFPSLGAQRTTGMETGPAGPSNIEMDRRPMGHPTPAYIYLYKIRSYYYRQTVSRVATDPLIQNPYRCQHCSNIITILTSNNHNGLIKTKRPKHILTC